MIRSRKLVLLIVDIAIFLIIGTIFLVVQNVSRLTWRSGAIALVFLTTCVFISRFLFGVYRQVWRYAGAKEYLVTTFSDFCGGLLYVVISRIIFDWFKDSQIAESLPELIMIWQAVSIVAVSCLCCCTIRNTYQLAYVQVKSGRRRNVWERKLLSMICGDELNKGREETDEKDSQVQDNDTMGAKKINVAIVGAGSIGSLLVNELTVNPKSRYKPYCFIDKDPQKVGYVVSGVKVYSENGIIDKIKSMPVQEIIIALPNLSGDEKTRLFNYYEKTGCQIKIYDFPYNRDEINNKNGKRVLREFAIEDLLFREPIHINEDKIKAYYSDKIVLITGGGGSIGSELCMQIAKSKPKQLIIFDIYENNAYEVQQELIRRYGDSLDLVVEISSVRDEKRIDEVFSQYRPNIVLHAAAHKHVPLMEHNCAEAIKNNVMGTYYMTNAAEKYGIEKFVLISTDKAVNPTSIMGASKRVCEMIIQSKQERCIERSKTIFAAVRFGNVLGSNGSVIPLFKQQIADGGPVTITDKRIIRYFMTIPEAADLVLEAGAMAKNGDLFALNMGKPIRIVEMAENMIKLSGLIPYVDIDIKEIGLRPGEKLFEELLIKSNKLTKTENDMIFIEKDKPISRAEIERKLKILNNAVEDGRIEAVKKAMRRTVPTYKEQDKEYSTKEERDKRIKNVQRKRDDISFEPQNINFN